VANHSACDLNLHMNWISRKMTSYERSTGLCLANPFKKYYQHHFWVEDFMSEKLFPHKDCPTAGNRLPCVAILHGAQGEEARLSQTKPQFLISPSVCHVHRPRRWKSNTLWMRPEAIPAPESPNGGRLRASNSSKRFSRNGSPIGSPYRLTVKRQ